MNEREDDALVAALRRLPREEAPPDNLEQQLVNRLREDRLLDRWLPLRTLRVAAAAVLAVVTFTGGYVTGNARPAKAVLPPTHILLVYESVAPEHRGSRAEEYGTWARKLAAAGLLTDGAELTPDISILRPSGTQPPEAAKIGGYFLLHARDDRQAHDIASACPHLRYGGALELRRLNK